MSIAPINTSATSGSQSTTSASGGLAADSNTFMKLLVANLQHQDPMQPQDSSSYMQQLSSMSMVEQLTSLATTTKSASESQKASAAVGLIGKTVSYVGSDGSSLSGVVQAVSVAGDQPTLTIDGTDGIDAGLVTEVKA